MLNPKSSDNVKFLKDFMNGFKVYKIIKKPEGELNYKAKDLYYCWQIKTELLITYF